MAQTPKSDPYEKVIMAINKVLEEHNCQLDPVMILTNTGYKITVNVISKEATG